jgi:hypothetical protein
MMQRWKKLLLSATALFVIAGPLTVWLIWFPPWVSSKLERRLLGKWVGSGQLTEELSSAPGEGVPGEKAPVVTLYTVQAEFKPDGTYTWEEELKEPSSLRFKSFMVLDSPVVRWEVKGSQGNKLTVRMTHNEVTNGREVVFAFEGEDTFTIDLPESAKASGTLTFRRSGTSKK